MKKSIILLLIITAIGCSKNTGMLKIVSTWSGTYSSTIKNLPQDFDSGTLNITVYANNSATGTLQSINGYAPVILKGAVNSSGDISISKYGEGDFGMTVFLESLNGKLYVDSAGGILSFPWASTSQWQATKN